MLKKMKNEDDTSGRRLHFNTHFGPISVEIEKILFLKGSRSYTELFLQDDNNNVLLTYNLHFMETILKKDEFLRCHNSWLVNMRKINSFYRKEKLLIITDYGVPVSRREWNKISHILSDEGIKPVRILNPKIKNLRHIIKNKNHL